MGTLVNATNTIKDEIRACVIAANRCYYGLAKQLRSKILSSKTKCNIYKTLIRPVLTYGSECSAVTKAEEDTLLIFERKILRKIHGPKYESGVWRRIIMNCTKCIRK